MTRARRGRGCAVCRGPMPPATRRGRPRLYCSDACRVAAQTKGIDREYANLRGAWSALPHDEITEMQWRRAEGWTIEQLANVYGVSTRTVQRYLARSRPVRVVVGKWQAWFCTTYNDAPRRIGEWELVPVDAEVAA